MNHDLAIAALEARREAIVQHACKARATLNSGVEDEILRTAMQSAVDTVVDDVEAIDEAVQVLHQDARARCLAASVFDAPAALWRWLAGHA